MKALLTLTIFLLSFPLLFAQSQPGRVYEITTAIPPDLVANTDSILQSKNLNKNMGKVKVDNFMKYLTANSSFSHLLVSYSVGRNNKLYFTARAVNSPQSGSPIPDLAKAVEEFSSLNGNSVKPDRPHKQNFNNKKGPGFQPEGFFLEMNSVIAMLQNFVNASQKNVEIDGLLTKDAGSDYLNLVFMAESPTAAAVMSFSTFDLSAGRMAPDTGCPPFNCN